MSRIPLWNRLPPWVHIAFLILQAPFLVIGVYAIYRFAVGSLRGAIIVGTLMTVWLIWVYVIWLRLQKRRERNSN